jgi:hypothetical protein
MRFNAFHIALASALAWACVGCADFQRGPAPPDGGRDATGGQVTDLTFETGVYSALLVRCDGCHSRGGQAGGSRMVLTGNARADRAMVVALVTPGKPSDSLLLQRATGDSHFPGAVIGQDSLDYQTIADWIAGLPTSP